MTEDDYEDLEEELSDALAANAELSRRVRALEQIVIGMTKRPEESFHDLKWTIIDEFLDSKQLSYTGWRRKG